MAHPSSAQANKSVHLIISGRVQGVNFRWFVLQNAEALSLTGFARNLPDGTVEVIAYGEKENLERLHEACRRGPRAGRVEEVRVEWRDDDSPPAGFDIG